MSKTKTAAKAQPVKRVKFAELSREVNYSTNNIQNEEKEWKQICLNVSSPSLRGELINCWHYFERVIDTKDFVISLCMDEIRKHEDLYQTNLQKHQNTIQNLMKALYKKLHDIHRENNKFLKTSIDKSFEDWKTQNHKADVAENYVKVMRFGMEVLKKRWDKMTRTDHFASRNEESSKHDHDIQQLSFVLELKLDGFWDRVRIAEGDYCRRIQENKKHQDVIKEIDDATNKTVQKELKKLMNLQDVAKRLASKFEELVDTMGKKVKYLELEKESLHELQFALRNKLMQNKDNDELKRNMMTIEFCKAFDKLNIKLKKGESMMNVLKVTRRYEICHEQMLPYPVRYCDKEASQKFSVVPQLRLFWQRVAEANAYRFALNEERTFLIAENEKLQKQIQSIRERLRVPRLPPIPQRVGKIPYTEGREMIQKNKIQNRRRI